MPSATNANDRSATIPTASFSNRVKRVLGLSLHEWENAMVVFLIAAGLFALLAGAATWAVVRLQRIELAASQRELDRYKTEAGLKIEEARREGIEADKTAGNAMLRAAELEKEAASARLETEKLKAAVTWRTISSQTAAKLERSLAAHPGSVNLRYTDGDPEALFLAIQFSKILSNAHWRVAPGASKPGNAILFGIILPDGNGADAEALRNAFTEAEIPFSPNPLPQTGLQLEFAVTTIPGAPMLMVGSRIPAIP